MLNYRDFFNNGISYNQYHQEFQNKMDDSYFVHEHLDYMKMNWQRTKRISKTFKFNDEEIIKLNHLDFQKWLVISEHWCGDASQILPILNEFQKFSDNKIEMKIIYRDEHLDLIDQHLTNGGRAIPKIVFLDENFNLLKDWGPRPKLAQELVVKLRSNPETAENYSEELHKWYAQDKQKEIVKEIIELMS